MIKRIVCLVLTLILSLSCCAALADDPQPIETIPYEELPPAIDGQHHYLLLCVDQWTGKPHNLGNTDGIVIVTLDTRAHRVMLTSIIRDALVERPDGVIGRINYIAKNYGPEALCKVISQHVGVKIEKYLLFDFSQIASIVDFPGRGGHRNHLHGIQLPATLRHSQGFHHAPPARSGHLPLQRPQRGDLHAYTQGGRRR